MAIDASRTCVVAQAGDGVQAWRRWHAGAHPRAGALPGPGPGVRTAAARRRTAAVQASSTPPGACEKRQRNWRPPRSTPPARPEPHGTRSARATDSPSKVPSNASEPPATRPRPLPRRPQARRPSRRPDPQAPHPFDAARLGGTRSSQTCRARAIETALPADEVGAVTAARVFAKNAGVADQGWSAGMAPCPMRASHRPGGAARRVRPAGLVRCSRCRRGSWRWRRSCRGSARG